MTKLEKLKQQIDETVEEIQQFKFEHSRPLTDEEKSDRLNRKPMFVNTMECMESDDIDRVFELKDLDEILDFPGNLFAIGLPDIKICGCVSLKEHPVIIYNSLALRGRHFDDKIIVYG